MKGLLGVLCAVGAAVILTTGGTALRAAGTLDIYFIDVEGGQSTLIVAPTGEAMLVDAGWSGSGNRDADRILVAARDAHVERLEALLVTHFHEDHAGGIPEVARRLPVATFLDYGEPVEMRDFAQKPFAAYAAIRARGAVRHPNPGDHLALGAVKGAKGVEIDVVTAGGALVQRALAGASGAPNPACATLAEQPVDRTENQRSLGVRLTFGRFTFLDLGDLSGVNLAALACPANLLGHADVYLVPHHGNSDSAIPAVVAAVTPRVAILNNGVTKGGGPPAFTVLRAATGIEDVWQLHRSRNEGADNYPDAFIANLDEGDKDAGAWIKLSADVSGHFTVTNARTGVTKSYK
jgi:beta-lactamase superfamily II metal-dependent hydrolase